MPPIGETLREARMRQRLDIADVEQRTKIRAKYLRALENEEWALLPGPTFVRTFLRTYAELLDLDAHVLVEEYRHAHEPADEGEAQASLAPAAGRDQRRPGRGGVGPPPRRGMVAAAVVVALLAFLLALGLLGGEDDSAPVPDRAGTTTTAPRAAEPEPSEREARRERRGQRRGERARPAGVRVTIAPVEPTYVCVDNGPATDVVFEDTIDSAQTFRHRRLVRLNVGKRSPEIALNGEPVEVADSSDPLGLELRPGGAAEIPDGERPCA